LQLLHNMSGKPTEIIKFFRKDLLDRHGIPKLVISDAAKQLVRSEFTSLCTKYGITHRTSAPYHQQANGQVEHMIQTLKWALIKQCNNSPSNWVDKISGIHAAMNNTPSETTGVSPHYALHGSECRTITESLFKDMSSERNRVITDNITNSKLTKEINRKGSERHRLIQRQPP